MPYKTFKDRDEAKAKAEKTKRSYRSSKGPSKILESLKSPTALGDTYAEVEAEREERAAEGEAIGAEARLRDARSEAEIKASLASREREPVEKILCPQCGVSFPEDDAKEFIDPDTGEMRVRCPDCVHKAKLAAALLPAKEAPPPHPDAEGLRGPGRPRKHPLPAQDDELDAVDRIEKESGRLKDENRTLRDKIAELERLVHQHKEMLVEAREGGTEHEISIEDAVVRIRDLEVLIGFEALQTPEAVSAAAPWMLELAARIVEEAPEALDQRGMTMMLIEAIHTGFSQRTAEIGRTMAEIASAPMGEQLLSLEQAVRHLSVAQRTIPDRPFNEKAEALTAAWYAINAAAADLREVLSAEVGTLQAQSAADVLLNIPKVPPKGEGRQFRLTRAKEQEDEG